MHNLFGTFTGIAASMVLTAAVYADAPETIEGATTVDANGLIELVMGDPNVVMLDNRREGDFEAGHIEGAIRLLNDDIASPADIAAHVASTDTPVLFYCNGLRCGRAADAAQKAISFGYTQVYYYARGIEEWRELGFPLITN